MLLAKEYLGEVGVGATSPLFFRANDDCVYVVKVMMNPLGGKILASESVAASFGRLLDLPFPASDYFCITEEWLREHPYLADSRITAGLHFASRYLENVQYVTPEYLPLIRNRPSIAGMILFDHLFHNADRAQNRKNMLLISSGREAYTLYGIDHSHLFRSGRWTIHSLSDWEYRIRLYDQNMYGMFLTDWIYANDFMPYIHVIQQIEDHTIKEVLRAVPREWLPDAREREALFHFVRTRFELVNDIHRKICHHIPLAHGGYYDPCANV